jgi:hypothetical protein
MANFDLQTKWFAEATPTNTNSATAEIGAGENGVVTVTVDDYGTEGNDYTIEVVVGDGNSVDLSAELTGTAIVVTLATDGSGDPDDTKNTATLVTAAIEALTGVSAEASGTGATALTTAEAEQSFAGGTYGTEATVPYTMLYVSPYYYVNIAPNTRDTSNWRRFQLGSAY